MQPASSRSRRTATTTRTRAIPTPMCSAIGRSIRRSRAPANSRARGRRVAGGHGVRPGGVGCMVSGLQTFQFTNPTDGTHGHGATCGARSRPGATARYDRPPELCVRRRSVEVEGARLRQSEGRRSGDRYQRSAERRLRPAGRYVRVVLAGERQGHAEVHLRLLVVLLRSQHRRRSDQQRRCSTTSSTSVRKRNTRRTNCRRSPTCPMPSRSRRDCSTTTRRSRSAATSGTVSAQLNQPCDVAVCQSRIWNHGRADSVCGDPWSRRS